MKSIKISGAKNSATRLLAAALITDEKTTLYNFPTELVDANHKRDFINNIGGKVTFDPSLETATIYSNHLYDVILEDYNYPVRTTYLFVPGMLKKTGIAKIPYPGGCKIGNRGYDLHVMVWESMGAIVNEYDDYIEVKSEKLKGSEINFPITTIGGTETALICGSIADGETIIKNAYISPEVNNLIAFLRSTGVEIEVIGNSYIRMKGENYHRGTTMRIIPDRIEAITWIIFAAISGLSMRIEDVPFEDMEIPLTHLKEAGIDFYSNKNSVMITPDCMPFGIQPFELATGTHPGVISDMQPFFVLLGLNANGISRIYDYRYPERTQYLNELSKFISSGLDWENGKITTTGIAEFNAARAESTDLRGSMAVVLAALLSSNKTPSKINNISMALRGYNDLEGKLKKLGFTFEINNNSLTT